MKQLIKRLQTDEALMQAYGRGDSLAFEVLYRRHKDPLFGFIYRSLDDRAKVEDLAHETWLGVINRAESYRPAAKFKTWLYSIAHRKLVDHWRQLGRWQQLAAQLEQQGGAEQASLESQRYRDELMVYIDSLPPPQRQAILLQQQGFGLAQIAEICDVKTETVKSRLRYGLAKLRALETGEIGGIGGIGERREGGCNE